MGFRGADCHVTKLVRSLSARISQTLIVLYLGQCAVRYIFPSEKLKKKKSKVRPDSKGLAGENKLSFAKRVSSLNMKTNKVLARSNRPKKSQKLNQFEIELKINFHYGLIDQKKSQK